MEAVGHVIRREIKKEINATSLAVEETTDVTNKAQVCGIK